MLNNIYTDFKNYLESAFPDIKIDEYRGEFKEKAPVNWNPSFPCCLIKLEEYSPVVRASSGEIIRHQTKFTLYIAEKNSLGYELIQQIVDNLNETHLSHIVNNSVPVIIDGGYDVEVDSVKFFTAVNSVRVHTLNITIF
ncbi:MAG: hypothetical protein JST55_14590 [Bacteroidetes bacterium]|nr:hypothetical protein [Bacteroidota bacterium]